MLSRIARLCTLIAIASLFTRIGIWKPYTLQPYECSIIVSCIVLCLHAYKTRDSRFLFLLQKYKTVFGIIHVLLALGIVCAWKLFSLSTESWVAIAKQFFYFYTVFIGFFCTSYFSESAQFRKTAIVLMCLPLLLGIFIPLLSVAEKLHLTGNGFTLIGLSGNPSILGFYLLIPFCFLSLQSFFTENLFHRFLYSIGVIVCIALLLWTGSRGAWLAASTMYGSLLLGYSRKLSYILFYTVIGLACIAISFLILPHPVKVMSLDRIFPQVTHNNPHPDVLEETTLSFKTITEHDTESTATLIPYQDRQTIWPQAFSAIAHYPFGLGPEYSRVSNAIIGPDGSWILAHNTFLQAALSGGIMLLAYILYLCFYVFITARSISEKKDRVFYTSIWIGFIILLLFNDNLFIIPWVWIVVGMMVGLRYSHSFITQSELKVNNV